MDFSASSDIVVFPIASVQGGRAWTLARWTAEAAVLTGAALVAWGLAALAGERMHPPLQGAEQGAGEAGGAAAAVDADFAAGKSVDIESSCA